MNLTERFLDGWIWKGWMPVAHLLSSSRIGTRQIRYCLLFLVSDDLAPCDRFFRPDQKDGMIVELFPFERIKVPDDFLLIGSAAADEDGVIPDTHLLQHRKDLIHDPIHFH